MSDKMREAIKEWLDANVHDGEDRSGASDVAYFTPDELQELVEECLEAITVQQPVAEVIPNTVGVEMAWIDPRNKPPVGTKLYALTQQSVAQVPEQRDSDIPGHLNVDECRGYRIGFEACRSAMHAPSVAEKRGGEQ